MFVTFLCLDFFNFNSQKFAFLHLEYIVEFKSFFLLCLKLSLALESFGVEELWSSYQKHSSC